MKTVSRLLIILVVTGGVIAALVFAYLGMRQERDEEAAGEAPVIAPSRVERSPEQGPVIRLDAETQKRLNLQIARPVSGSLTQEIIANARVLDPAGLAALLSELRSAQAGVEAASKDYERKRKLFENGQNAAASAVEQAEAVMEQRKLAVDSVSSQIAARWGPGLVRRADLPAFVASLLERNTALVRVDLLSSDNLATNAPTFRLLHHNGEPAATAQLVGPAPIADSATVGQSLLALVATNASTLVPGATFMARLDTGIRDSGMVIPRSAVVRHAGLGWVYVQLSADTFARRVLPLDRAHPDGWLASGEWTQPVVITGAQSLLSEELKGSIQMKD